MSKHIGILTAGGDSPGLNAAIRAIGKAAEITYNMNVIGFRDGFRGLMENRFIRLHSQDLAGILTKGGTILGANRDKPHKMPVGDKIMDMTDVMVNTYKEHHLDALVCIGGGGTQKNAYRLVKKGLNIITLPKTIDNDVAETDFTFGYDTAMGIATSAIDRLHSTAHSHHRIIVVEIMGHNTGWLTLGAGIAGGADVILIPEIPYDIETIATAIKQRRKEGKNFSIIAIAEGALTKQAAKKLAVIKKKIDDNQADKEKLKQEYKTLEKKYTGQTMKLSDKLDELTGLESRVTILGHLQRGGTPSAYDRVLATQLGTACADMIEKKQFGIMIAHKNGKAIPVPLKDVVGFRKTVPLNHPWIFSAREIGVCLGDK